MGKVPIIVPQGTRYEPYSNALRARRRRGSASPDRWGIRAGSREAQLTDGIVDLLDNLSTRYGGGDLRELLRGHANQSGALGEAIGTWVQFDEIRGRRKLEPTNFIKTQRNDQSHCNYAPEHIRGGERRASRPPVGQQNTRHVSQPPSEYLANESYLPHSPQTPRFDYTPAGERLFDGPPNSPCTGAVESPRLGSFLRIMRGVAAPPLISLPPSEPYTVHGSSTWSEKPVVNSHNEQGCISPRSPEGSYHAAFWETAGWTPEEGHQGSSEDGPRIPPYLKGKGRARLGDPNEGGESPEEQGSSGWNPPQHGNPPHRIPVLASTAPQGYMGPVSPEIPIKLQPQDEDSNPIARHQEGKRDRNEEPEHEQGPPQPEHQPALRRSKRIKAMKDAAPPKVKAPAKSTGRKRAVRKK